MNNSIINIVYCTDSNYLEHVGVSITSIILNNKHHNIHFHIFLYDVSEEEKQIKGNQQFNYSLFNSY